jgi:sugar phosphate isomerase/epimerase
VRILCFGSGGARRVPDGFSKDEAFAQLVAFGTRIAPEAKAHGITVVIEPLRRQETNIINTAAEGFALVKAVATRTSSCWSTSTTWPASTRTRRSWSRPRTTSAPAHGQPAGPGVPAGVGRVRLRAVLRHAPQHRYTGRLSIEARRRTCRPGAPIDRAAAQGFAGELTAPAQAR